MKINAERLSKHFKEMSKIGKIGETGTCRPAHSPEEKEAFLLASGWMHEAGMQTRIDNFGNLIGRVEGTKPELPVLMLGSHLDSQPYGGRFDGAAGVLCAIEAITTLFENGIKPERGIDVVSFADEESWRFKKGLFGSRGILGMLEAGELQRADHDGVTRERALLNFGCDISKFSESEYAPGSIFCFLELHIEQGPILDKGHQPVGIVTGIAGPLWLTVKVKGMAGHTGSVPMHLRQDALLGAAHMIVGLNKIVTQVPGTATVGTVATIDVFPASRNIIAQEVSFTIDLRDIDLDRRNSYEAEIREMIGTTAKEHNLTCEITEDTNNVPRYSAGWIRDIIKDECASLKLDAPELMSGPFHDAMVMSYACDFGMIFVRCKDGISHNPLEYASDEDLAIGTEVLYGTVLKVLEK